MEGGNKMGKLSRDKSVVSSHGPNMQKLKRTSFFSISLFSGFNIILTPIDEIIIDDYLTKHFTEIAINLKNRKSKTILYKASQR